MSTVTITSRYLLLFRGQNYHKGLSPEEIQTIAGQWTTWSEQLTQQGKVKAAHPLENESKIISWKKGRTVVDGPFAESKEAVTGYFLLEVDGLDEAIEIAKACPALEYGLSIEVRPVWPELCLPCKAQTRRSPATREISRMSEHASLATKPESFCPR
jgi:hypothetical protein